MVTELAEGLRAQVRKFVVFPVPPHVLHRIEFRGVARETLQGDPAALAADVVADDAAAMGGQAVPDDEQLAAQMALEVAEEFDDQVIPAIAESRFQLKWYWSTGVCPRGAHVRQRWGRSVSPLSSTKTIVCPWTAAFFLPPASALASSAGSPPRPAPARGPSAAGSSSRAA